MRKWEELIDVAETPDLEGLAHLTDRGLQIFLREVGQLDLIRVMSTLSQPVCEFILRNMSKRVQQFIRTEIGLLGEVGEKDLATSRDRMVQSLLDLAQQGWLQWPPGAESTALPRTASDVADLSAELRFAHMYRPLLDVSEADLAQTLLWIAEQARHKGILSLETLPSTTTTLLTEAVQYVVDGTEPNLVQDLVKTRGATILRHRRRRAGRRPKAGGAAAGRRLPAPDELRTTGALATGSLRYREPSRP